LSGEKFGAYLRNHIFAPLAMNETSFFLEEKDRERLAELYEWNRTAGKLDVLPDQAGRGYFKADHVESGGGGLVSTAHDYARFLQALLNKGELDGKRILKPETVALMMENHSGDLTVFGQRGTGFGLGMAVVHTPAANSKQGAGTNNWFGIAGTWFWIDPKNDLFFIGMIQRRGGTPPNPVNLRGESNTLTYEALRP
jgi:CubicO group peptidase (beta-lactamase class C family)